MERLGNCNPEVIRATTFGFRGIFGWAWMLLADGNSRKRCYQVEKMSGAGMKTVGVLTFVFFLVAYPLDVRSQSPAPTNARAYIIWAYDGSVIEGGKLWVRMGLPNFGVAPAGVDAPNNGHHHLFINNEFPDLDEPNPNDKNFHHF